MKTTLTCAGEPDHQHDCLLAPSEGGAAAQALQLQRGQHLLHCGARLSPAIRNARYKTGGDPNFFGATAVIYLEKKSLLRHYTWTVRRIFVTTFLLCYYFHLNCRAMLEVLDF